MKIRDLRKLNLVMKNYGTFYEIQISKYHIFKEEVNKAIDNLFAAKNIIRDEESWMDYYEEEEFYTAICKTLDNENEIFFCTKAEDFTDDWELIGISQWNFMEVNDKT